MGFWGMNEKELKSFADQLEAKDIKLRNRESDVKQGEQNLQYEQGKLLFDRSGR